MLLQAKLLVLTINSSRPEQIILPDNTLTNYTVEAGHVLCGITVEKWREIRNIAVKLAATSREIPERWYSSKPPASMPVSVQRLVRELPPQAKCYSQSNNHRVAIFRYLRHPAIPANPIDIATFSTDAIDVLDFWAAEIQAESAFNAREDEDQDQDDDYPKGHEDFTSLPNLQQYLLLSLSLGHRARLVSSACHVPVRAQVTFHRF